MSLDVNITKNYSPKKTLSTFTNFNFINLAQPPLLIEHHHNLARYQIPNPIILYLIHLNVYYVIKIHNIFYGL